MKLVDSHCHLDCLDLSQLGGSLDAVMQTAAQHEVTAMLCVSINLEDYPAMLALVRQYPQVYASVGVHPNEHQGKEPAIDELVGLAADPKVVAIGETGLDYFRSDGDLDWQRERFRRHIQAAQQAGMPLIIHTRDAAEDTLRIMREEQAAQVGGVMHCFTGDWATAEAALALGFYISFSGIVTFKTATVLKEVACRVPDNRLLIETDSPYLTPIPFRGKPNQPAYVRYVAEHIAELRGTSLAQIATQSTDNFNRLFNILT